jgi:required for meiotic nuclear division protein 1
MVMNGDNMEKMIFKAFAVTKELDLNKIAVACNIRKKYTWEEPLVLHQELLTKILGQAMAPDKTVLVFSFGSVVFINNSLKDIDNFFEYLRLFQPAIDVQNTRTYSDDYELRIEDSAKLEFTDQYITIPIFDEFFPEIISTVIAKSVALEKIEEHLETILDKVEGVIDRLEKGKLHISDKEVARVTAQIVRHEYNTISYVMILDKPDSTWIHSSAGTFYDQMADFFELSDRYEILQHKTNTLKNILDGFTSVSHSIRMFRLEWAVVILFILEVILMALEYWQPK